MISRLSLRYDLSFVVPILIFVIPAGESGRGGSPLR